MKYIVSVGEMLIDFIPDVQVQAEKSPCYSPHPGGSAANVAVAVARLGGASRYIGALSQDGFGQLLTKTLLDNRVDASYVQTVKEATTLALVTLQNNGERQFSFYRTGMSDTLLSVENLDWQAWQDAAICHVGSVSLSVDPARSTIFAVIEHTRQRGALVSFDANIRTGLWSSHRAIQQTIDRVVERVDILKFSAEEAGFMDANSTSPLERLAGPQLLALGKRLLERGPRLVIITLDAQGVLLLTPDYQIEVPTQPVRVVDATGAGDAFMGAVLCKLVQLGKTTLTDLQHCTEEELRTLGSFANRVAGITCTRFGGIASLPFLNEIEA